MNRDQALDAAVQRIIQKIQRFDVAFTEAKAIIAASPDDGVVSVRIAKTLVEAIEILLPKSGRA